MWFRDFYPKSRPKAVKGGIKAQSKTGAFGKSWWAKRWIAVLEGFNIGSRLQRGRSYARGGQVTSITVAPGKVTAKVQGSRPQPYSVTIEVPKLAEKDWTKLIAELSAQAGFVAKLLAGEMPQDIETAFTGAGLSLFPKALKEITTECSCPDYSNPCKHIAAVYYLLGEEFDRDPFLLFRLRGADREMVCGRLAAPGAPAQLPGPVPEPVAAPEPLPAGAASFWAAAPLPADLCGEVRLPPVSAAGPKRLGGFPFWRGTERFLDALAVTYPAAARRGLALYEIDGAPDAAAPAPG
ncbi:MAG TPA: SWIM zinc finger family protein [Gemmata sp.]